MFSARGLKKYFGREKVLDLEALEIPRGEVTVFLGHNGAGKTTILRILSLLERPSAGTLFMDGRPVNLRRNALELRRRMTLAHQTPYLFKGSVFFNVAYGLRQEGIPESEVATRVARALAFSDLEGFKDRLGSELSGGEAQRVALARALVLERKILLLDEPVAHVDVDHINLVIKLIRKTREEKGTTVVVATHDKDFCRQVADQVLHLYKGALVDGASDDVGPRGSSGVLPSSKWSEGNLPQRSSPETSGNF